MSIAHETLKRALITLRDSPETIKDIKNISDTSFDSEFYGFKVTRKELGPKLQELWDILADVRIPKKLLYKTEFLPPLWEILWALLRTTGLATHNLSQFLPYIRATIEGATAPGFLITDCRGSEQYYCGRAFITIERGPARLLLFDTVPPDEMNPVTIAEYMGLDEDTVGFVVDKPYPMCGDMRFKMRLPKELEKITKLPFANELSYKSVGGLIAIRVKLACGCVARLQVPCAGEGAYPVTEVRHLFIGSIPYTLSPDEDYSMTHNLVDLLQNAYTAHTTTHDT